jgi:hypothetical protein
VATSNNPAERGKRDSVVPRRRIDLYTLTPGSRSALRRTLASKSAMRVVSAKREAGDLLETD